MSTGGTVTPQTDGKTASLHETGNLRLFAILCYGLYLAALLNGITALIGVVIAYVKRSEARGTIYESHFNNLISIFWLALIVFVAFVSALVWGITGIALAVFGAGLNTVSLALLLPAVYLLTLAALVWFLFRTVSGLLHAVDAKAYR